LEKRQQKEEGCSPRQTHLTQTIRFTGNVQNSPKTE
jgi:hypothetical protein